jgi:hypothetical protein
MEITMDLDKFLEQYSEIKNIEEAFTSLARKSRGYKRDLDLSVPIQSQYRRSRNWDNYFHFVKEAEGYLGGMYNKIAEYMFEKISLPYISITNNTN